MTQADKSDFGFKCELLFKITRAYTDFQVQISNEDAF